MSCVNKMTRTAKANWLWLLANPAIVRTTRLGVIDEEFSLLEPDTALPLMGIAVPTVQVFYVAKALDAALRAYVHPNCAGRQSRYGAVPCPGPSPHSCKLSASRPAKPLDPGTRATTIAPCA